MYTNSSLSKAYPLFNVSSTRGVLQAPTNHVARKGTQMLFRSNLEMEISLWRFLIGGLFWSSTTHHTLCHPQLNKFVARWKQGISFHEADDSTQTSSDLYECEPIQTSWGVILHCRLRSTKTDMNTTCRHGCNTTEHDTVTQAI